MRLRDREPFQSLNFLAWWSVGVRTPRQWWRQVTFGLALNRADKSGYMFARKEN